MKTRFTVDANGVLTDREGNALGRLTSLTLELAEAPSQLPGNSGQIVGTMGDSLFENQLEEEKEQPHKPHEIEEVWAVYDRLIGKGRRQYVARTHGAMILDAIKATGDIELVKKAIVGLSRSTHHMGHNEQHRTYNDLRYALKPIRGTGETIQERVEKMARYVDASPGALAVPPTRDRGVLEGRIESDKGVVRDFTSARLQRALTHDEDRRLREATQRLADLGITITFRQSDGWPLFTDQDQEAHA
jgi:hypothetical protein